MSLSNKIFIFFILSFSTLNALSLKEAVQKTFDNNPEIKAELHNEEAFQEYVDEKKAAYYPTLDLNADFEKNRKKNDPTNSTKNTVDATGWKATLSLEQILYNGGLTSAEIDENQANYIENKHKRKENIEKIIIKSLNAYLGIVQYKELMSLSEDIIVINKDNLITAKDKEEISGEVLETYQVSSKLHSTQEKYLEQVDLYQKNRNNFKRYVLEDAPELICRPIIHTKNIPNTLSEALKKGVLNHPKVLAAVEGIKKQKAKLAQNSSRFLPTIKLQLESTWDSDLELADNGMQKEYLGRINLSWNFFSGGKDQSISQRERKFLLEAQENLNAVTDEVKDEIQTAYSKYHKNLKRVELLKLNVEDNFNIVDVYKQEFDAGTRTFIDILNAQTELYQANSSLVNREFSLFVDYYDLLLTLSTLSTSILEEDKQVCQKIVKKEKKKEEESVDDLLNELFKDEPVSNQNIKEDALNISSIKSEKSSQENLSLNMNNNTNSMLTSSKQIDGFLENKILSLTNDNHIINLATISANTDVNVFISEYELNESLITVFVYGENSQYKKILYGNYETFDEVTEILSSLNKKVLKNKPYISRISKNKDLYNKFH